MCNYFWSLNKRITCISLHRLPDLEVNIFALKLKVCTLSSGSLFNFTQSYLHTRTVDPVSDQAHKPRGLADANRTCCNLRCNANEDFKNSEITRNLKSNLVKLLLLRYNFAKHVNAKLANSISASQWSLIREKNGREKKNPKNYTTLGLRKGGTEFTYRVS